MPLPVRKDLVLQVLAHQPKSIVLRRTVGLGRIHRAVPVPKHRLIQSAWIFEKSTIFLVWV